MQNDLREALDRLKMAAHVYEDDEMAADCATLEALLSARPLALGGQQGEDAAWSWLNQHVECDPSDRDYSADEMVDAFMAGQSTTPARAEAQDEGAAKCCDRTTIGPWCSACLGEGTAVELKPCPGCGDAEPIYVGPPDAPEGKVFVGCDTCGFRSMACPKSEHAARFWNRRAHPSPTPAADADRVRIAVEALEPFARRADYWEHINGEGGSDRAETRHAIGDFKKARKALAALKSEGK